jgi:hypothetical protein
VGNVVFVTSQTFGSNLGGLAGADAKCAAAAIQGGLPGTFKAWLSDGTATADSRMNHSTKRYVLPDGTVVAEDYASLLGATLRHAINLTEKLGPPPDTTGFNCNMPAPGVWTATAPDGTLASDTCSNWGPNDGGDTTAFGDPSATDTTWTDLCSAGGGCSATASLYCIQQ